MRSFIIYLYRIFPIIFLLMSCTTDPADLYHKMTKIDAHVHIRTEQTDIMEFAISEGFKLITISVRSDDQEYIDKQNHYGKLMHEKYPESISYLTTFSMENFEDPDWAEHVIEKLREDFAEGAVGVKVWKDIGMTFRDSLGRFIFIDDPRFDPVFEFIIGQGKTVVGHIGEPRDCWLPLDSMHLNNHRNYYKGHPEYHMYLHPDYPKYEEIIASRDNMLERHPDLRFVGAHLGSLEWSVDELAKRLDRYPNFAVDMSARVGNLQAQDHEKVRDFIVKYQDRLLYGTDFQINEGDDFEKRKASLERDWRLDWKYFTTDEMMESPDVNGSFRGLKLDKEVLQKIYCDNAMNWIPGLFQ
jgi:predicted TIM-barrel fold metal-dependent hydrolase